MTSAEYAGTSIDNKQLLDEVEHDQEKMRGQRGRLPVQPLGCMSCPGKLFLDERKSVF